MVDLKYQKGKNRLAPYLLLEMLKDKFKSMIKEGHTMKFTRIFFVFLLPVLLTGVREQSSAMPNFARRYNMSCSGCHNGVPRLNEFGFKFRAAGFRTPEEIGKAESSGNIGDYIAARTQARADWNQTEAPNGAVTLNSKQLTFVEFTVYPISGGFAKNFASLVELSFLPEEAAEVENG